MWSLARRLCPDDPEDAVQEIFIDVWRNAWRFREGVGSEVAFVSTLARRRLVDRRRRAERTPRVVPLDVGDVVSSGVDSAERTAAFEDVEQIRRCIGELTERSRRAIELSVFDGLSQARIAEQLGAPLGTVKTLIRRSLLSIRDCVLSSTRSLLDGGSQ